MRSLPSLAVRPAPEKDSAMRDFKPWWERVADFNDADQQEFLLGVYQGKLTYRPPQPSSHLLGLSAGYQSREFAKPDSWTGRPNDNLI